MKSINDCWLTLYGCVEKLYETNNKTEEEMLLDMTNILEDVIENFYNELEVETK